MTGILTEEIYDLLSIQILDSQKNKKVAERTPVETIIYFSLIR